MTAVKNCLKSLEMTVLTRELRTVVSISGGNSPLSISMYKYNKEFAERPVPVWMEEDWRLNRKPYRSNDIYGSL